MESFNDWLFVTYGIGAMDLTDDDYDALYEEFLTTQNNKDS